MPVDDDQAILLINEQPSFHYIPLVHSSTCTRLLRLFPGKRNSLIECELTNVEVPVDEVYETLSYEWATPGDTHLIIVNGEHFTV